VRSIVVIGGISAITHARRYGTNAALWTSVRGIGCDSTRRFLATVLLAADERVALELAGWRIDRVDRFRADGVRVHQVWAVQGDKRIIFVRRGLHPRVGRSVYRAGLMLHFPRSALDCTSAFVIRLRIDRSLFGLTASRGGVRAVGVLARSSVGGLLRAACYTPIQTVMATFGAELPTGTFTIAPPPPPPPGTGR
jgi:hypothetical protein